MTLIRALPRAVIGATALAALTACSTASNLIPDRRADYRTSAQMSPLEVPPDLTSSTIDDTLSVPDLVPGAGSASLAAYAGERQGGQVAGREAVLVDVEGMRVERSGERRWLVVDAAPEALWPRLRSFWTSNGFELTRDDARIGILETQWVENRADIPRDAVRALLGKVLEFAYSSPTRDRFRVRMERGEQGVEVFLTHYGVLEVEQGGRIFWQPRPQDPELEAEMLSRLMVYLGAEQQRAAGALGLGGAVVEGPARARIIDGPEAAPALQINEDYARAWRLVGLALDGSPYTVEEQSRNTGLYVVEARPAVEQGKSDGVLSGLMFWRKDEPIQPGERLRIRLAAQGAQTLVVVHDRDGQPERSGSGQRVLELLLEAIR